MEDTFDAWYIDNMEDDHDCRPSFDEYREDEIRRDVTWYFTGSFPAPSSFPPPF